MGRKFRSASSGDTVVNAIKVQQGGTNVTNATAARTSFNAANEATINQPNGIVGLNSLGKVTDTVIDGLLTSINLEGDLLEVPIYGELVLSISDYSAFQSYIVECTNGICRRQDNLIYYTANGDIGTGTLTINGRTLEIEITETKPNTPVIEYPTNYLQTIDTNITVYSSSYVSLSNIPHLSTDWELATDIDFTNIVQSSYNDTVNLLSWNITNLVVFSNYYIRSRYKDSEGRLSNWSNVTAFRINDKPYPESEQAILTASDGVAGDNFGESVAISKDGNTVVIGALESSTMGAAYVFTRSGTTWSQEAKLTASDPAVGDHFSHSLAISDNGTRIIIGAHNKDASIGAAYIYFKVNNNWIQQAKITDATGVANDNFAYPVTISGDGDTLLIGAHGDDSFTGCGYIYKYDDILEEWVYKSKINGSDIVAGDYFSWCSKLTYDGNTAVMTSYYKNSQQGAVYVFVYDSDIDIWLEQAKLTASDGVAGDQFGYSVAISKDGNTIVVGSLNAQLGVYTDAGAAYVFNRSGTNWNEVIKLTASDSAASSYFGISVDINSAGNAILIGARNTEGKGGVYCFSLENNIWIEKIKLIASDGSSADQFGNSVSISDRNGYSVIGSYTNDDLGTNSGSAYIFS